MAEAACDAMDWSVDQGGAQYLAFSVGDERYAIDILRVQEIKGQTPITGIPNAPPFVRGVINLRGTVVPVVDLGHRLGIGESAYGKFHVIILVTLRQKVIGLVVDAVSDVLEFAEDAIGPAPDMGAAVNAEFMSGVAVRDDQMVMLLDIERVLGGEELAALGLPVA